MNLILIFKLLPKILLGFKDVSEIYKDETGKDRPAYLSRRFIGAMLGIISIVLVSFTNIKFDSTVIDGITNNIDQTITALLALYSTIMIVIGQLKKDKTK